MLLKEETNSKTQPVEDDFNYLKNIERLGISQYCKHIEIWDALIEEDRNLKCKVNGMMFYKKSMKII